MDINIILFAVVVATAWTRILTEEGNLFAFFPNYVQRLTDNAMIQKVLYECNVCLGGQIGLWYSIFAGCNVITIIFNSCAAMVGAWVLNKLME